MSYAIYKIIHLTGVMMIFLSLGGLICRSILADNEKRLKRFAGITIGIGLIIVLISGFGLITKLSIGFPGWIIGKLTIWIIIGGLIGLINRKGTLGVILWWLIIGLGCIAATLAVNKPF